MSIPPLDSDQFGHTSLVFKLFVEWLDQRQEIQVLDIGPTCNNNINYLASRVSKLYVCDMYLHLDKSRCNGHSPNQVWRYLDHPPNTFDGIMLWDFVDYLDDFEVRILIDLCHKIMKKGSMIVLFANGEQSFSSVVKTYLIKDSNLLHVQPHVDQNLRMRIRSNREILAMLDPFVQVKSYLYEKGFREFLFQRV